MRFRGTQILVFIHGKVKIEMMVRRFVSILLLFLMSLVDWLAWSVGIQLCALTADGILRGLSPEATKEALESDIAEPLALFLDDVKDDYKNMHLLTRVELKLNWRKCITMRPRIKQIMESYPDVEETPVVKPIFLIGMHRTGTTLLQRLMALDSRLFTPMLWELYDPLPTMQDGQPIEAPGRGLNYENSPRYQHAERMMDAAKLLNAAFLPCHEIHAQDAEECSVLLSQTPLTPALIYELAVANTPSWRNWIYSEDHDRFMEGYRVYKQLMKIVGYKSLTNKRFLSKAPLHVFGLEALMKTFPDAKFIYSYRRLTDVVPSFMKMSELTHALPVGDKNAFGERCMRQFSTLANGYVKMSAEYDNSDENPLFNYAYRDMMKDPIAMVRRIYKHIELDLSPDLELRMRRYLQEKPQHKYGKMDYSLQEYGITRARIERDAKPFLDYFHSKGARKEHLM